MNMTVAMNASAPKANLGGTIRSLWRYRLLSVPPLAAIPRIITKDERKTHKRAVRYAWQRAIVEGKSNQLAKAAAIQVAGNPGKAYNPLASVIALALIVHFLVLPLDVVWLSLLRRFGV